MAEAILAKAKLRRSKAASRSGHFDSQGTEEYIPGFHNHDAETALRTPPARRVRSKSTELLLLYPQLMKLMYSDRIMPCPFLVLCTLGPRSLPTLILGQEEQTEG